MVNKLIQVYYIDPDTKLDKLDEEVTELEESIQEYRLNNDIKPVLNELVDCLVIVLGIAIVKHSVNIKEFKSMLDYKLNRSIRIKKIMKETGKSYEEVRKNVRSVEGYCRL